MTTIKKRYIILTVTILLFTSIFATGCTQKQTSVTLNPSTEDDQPYWNIFGRYITKCENGYYCIEQIEAGTNRICYLDNETKNQFRYVQRQNAVIQMKIAMRI